MAKYDVYAAGGIVIRGPADSLEVALIHRDRYDDWALPKGKADDGETPRQTALREVEEETGLTCRIIEKAGRTDYKVSSGMKRVDYFLMRPIRATPFEPNDEVDAIDWLSLKKARKKATYGFDQELLGRFDVSDAPNRGALHLVRHGAAGDRSNWEGDDIKRPLTKKGKRQADALAGALGPLNPDVILSSPYKRCVQTVEPLARALGMKVEIEEALAEDPDHEKLAELLDRLGGTEAVLSSHGDVIPALLGRLQRMGVEFRSPYEGAKGSTWVIGHDGTDYTDARYFPPPS